jgi:uncharacterized repeat protein (TIGR03803 family)
MSSNWKPLARISTTVARASRGAMVLVITAVLVSFATQSLEARTLKILYEFKGQPDGSGPNTGPIQDKQGNFYSTTYAGGIMGWGAVYKIDPRGKETVLHSFVGGKDGVTPTSGLIMDAEGNLYGTTYWGGNQDCFNGNGCGLVYKLSPGKHGWKETILYAFTGAADGAYPGDGTLVRDAAGNFYGTTLYGGSENWPNGGGTVFKLTHTSTGWKEHVLYAFGARSQTDGASPYGGVILDAAGNIYGTTYYGGNSSCGCGIVFKIDHSGSETVLHNFEGGTTDGGGPMVALVRDEAGTLYGTTAYGGYLTCSYPIGCGTAFKIDANGVETLLHIFIGYPSDGDGPRLLVRDTAGHLYGTAGGGGDSSACHDSNNEPSGCGVIFGLNTNGDEIILHNFTPTEGVFPAGLNLYGGSLYGVLGFGNGAVFKFTR